ncbi:MAG: ROK family transcriptional regulator [Deltaproteobacteria bacterium]|nr:ROK family transcriptional regulator [Deltaproteobacteria bacterium]
MTVKKNDKVHSLRKSGRDSDTNLLGNAYIRAVNRARIIDLFRSGQLMSRADLARHCDLSKPTVSAIVDDLINEGVLQEAGKRSSEGGRRARLLELNPGSSTFAGIHFGESVTQVAVTDAFGRILAKRFAETVTGRPEQSMVLARELVVEALAAIHAEPERVNAVGVSVPGLVSRQGGTCKIAPNLGWHNYPVAKELARLLGVEVYVANTTQTAALAEYQMGVARDVQDFVWLYVGNGVGSCAVQGGRIQFGSRGFAGEIGHVHVDSSDILCGCGKRGCLETTCSNLAIVRAFKQAMEAGGQPTSLSGKEKITAQDVSQAASNGDALAEKVMKDAGRALGVGAAMAINMYDPQMVVIGGPVAGADEIFLSGVRERVGELALESAGTDIVFSHLGRDIYLQGAVSMAMEQSNAAYRIVKSARSMDIDDSDDADSATHSASL